MRERQGERQVLGRFSVCSEHVLPFGVFMKDCHRDLNNFTFLCLGLGCIDTELYQDDVTWHLGFMWSE